MDYILTSISFQCERVKNYNKQQRKNYKESVDQITYHTTVVHIINY